MDTNIISVIKMVKVSIELEDTLHRELKKEAIDRGLTLKKYIVGIIKNRKV